MDKAVPVVVVCKNNLHLTKKTIASALRQDIPVEVLAINNFSNDGTAAWLNQKPLTVVHTPKQWSLAKCWNVALQALWKAGHTRALVVNNDVELKKDTVSLITAYMDGYPDRPFVTCVSVGSEDQMGEHGDRHWTSFRAAERPHPDFSAFVISKSVTDKIGWFNEEYYPAYAEDAEAHLRMHRAGIRAVCVDIPFLHHSASTVKNCNETERRQIERGAGRNRLLFKKTYGCLPGSPEYYALFGHTEPAPHAMA